MTAQLFRLICTLGPAIISLATTGVINTQVGHIIDEISNNFLENNNRQSQTINKANAIGAVAASVGLLPVKIVMGTIIGATKGAFSPIVGPIINTFNNKASTSSTTIEEVAAETISGIASNSSNNNHYWT